MNDLPKIIGITNLLHFPNRLTISIKQLISYNHIKRKRKKIEYLLKNYLDNTIHHGVQKRDLSGVFHDDSFASQSSEFISVLTTHCALPLPVT